MDKEQALAVTAARLVRRYTELMDEKRWLTESYIAEEASLNLEIAAVKSQAKLLREQTGHDLPTPFGKITETVSVSTTKDDDVLLDWVSVHRVDAIKVTTSVGAVEKHGGSWRSMPDGTADLWAPDDTGEIVRVPGVTRTETPTVTIKPGKVKP